MADGELEEIAADAGSLTDVARAALQHEISRRKLGIGMNLEVSPGDAWPPGPTTLRRFRDLPDALLAKSILDSASIECFLADENIIRTNWLLSDFLGGVKLWVREEDADAARCWTRSVQKRYRRGRGIRTAPLPELSVVRHFFPGAD
jgi:hypothetical protein